MAPEISPSAARQARHKTKLAASGLRQINLTAPELIHDLLREIARRARAGEDLAAVLVSINQGLAGKRLTKLEMRGEAMANRLARLPTARSDKVNVAAACAAKASGGVRRKLKSLGLIYVDRIFAGPVDAPLVEDLRRSVEATGGAFITDR